MKTPSGVRSTWRRQHGAHSSRRRMKPRPAVGRGLARAGFGGAAGRPKRVGVWQQAGATRRTLAVSTLPLSPQSDQPSSCYGRLTAPTPPSNEAHPPSGNTCVTTTPPPTCRFQPDKVVVGQGGTRGVENSKWSPLNMAPPTWSAFQPAPDEASPGGRARSRPGWFRRCGWPSETRWCVATAWGDAPHARGLNAATLTPIGPAVQLLRPFDCTYPPQQRRRTRPAGTRDLPPLHHQHVVSSRTRW